MRSSCYLARKQVNSTPSAAASHPEMGDAVRLDGSVPYSRCASTRQPTPMSFKKHPVGSTAHPNRRLIRIRAVSTRFSLDETCLSMFVCLDSCPPNLLSSALDIS